MFPVFVTLLLAMSEPLPNDEHVPTRVWILDMLRSLAIAYFLIVLPINILLFRSFLVEGESMLPNFHNRELLIINQLGYQSQAVLNIFSFFQTELFPLPTWNEFSRLDTVVFRYPRDPSTHFVKRVIGLPGETVSIVESKIRIVNAQHPEGMVLDESTYLPGVVYMRDMTPVVLGADQYFVMGDNRDHSNDSRIFGPVDRRYMTGRVAFRVLPPWQFTKY